MGRASTAKAARRSKTSSSPTSEPLPSRSVLDVIRDERAGLQTLVAHELEGLGFPAQQFDIQASFLTFDRMSMGIRLVWPMRMEFQGKPTGVIQIGTRKRTWNPETRCVIAYARVMSGDRMREEVRQWCRSMAAGARMAVERRGGEWPAGWPRYIQRGEITIEEMPTGSTAITQSGTLHT